MKKYLQYFLLVFLISCTTDALTDLPEKQSGETEIKRVIYMIGDGMGMNHVELLRLEQNRDELIFDKASGKGKITTFSANNKITDSAAAGTALACGQKTNNAMIGITPDGTPLASLLKLSKSYGWKTGIIVTCYLTHATPAAFYANSQSRDYDEVITRQLLKADIDVLVGGGINNSKDPAFLDTVRNVFSREDYLFTNDPSGLKNRYGKKTALSMTDRGFLPPVINGRDPGLMSSVTQDVLNNFGDDPFFLMIEGSQIDTQSHGNNIAGVIEEVADFERIARVCFDYADSHPGTLVVITADHETGGLTLPDQNSDKKLPASGIPYSFSTDYHTDAMVPVYAYGTRSQLFNGEYDNTVLFDKLKSLLSEKQNVTKQAETTVVHTD